MAGHRTLTIIKPDAAGVQKAGRMLAHLEAQGFVLGSTDRAEAAEGTVRKLFAESKGRNAIHASDSDENAAVESDFFFPGLT